MRFQVFLSLWSDKLIVIDTIPEVAKIKVSKPEIFFIKVKILSRPPKTAHSNTPPCVYVKMWKYLHNAAQMFMQRKKALFQ